MPGRARGWRYLTALLLCGGVAYLSSACESLFLHDEPEQVTVRIDSQDAGSVEVVTSMFFFYLTDPDCPNCAPNVQLAEADTATRTLPYQETWRFTDRQQFFVETYPTQEDSVTLRLRVEIDGQSWYDDSRKLGAPETLRFVYQFREPTLN